jgi:hypothetical protein
LRDVSRLLLRLRRGPRWAAELDMAAHRFGVLRLMLDDERVRDDESNGRSL